MTIPAANVADVVAGTSRMRVRVHYAQMGDPASLASVGHANDGEVEDYRVTISGGAEISGKKWHDVNGNGIEDPGELAWRVFGLPWWMRMALFNPTIWAT